MFASMAEEAKSSGGGGLLVGPKMVVVNLDEAPGDEVNPGGVSQITGGFELDQSLDVAAEGQMRVRRVILDTQQPKNGAELEQPTNGARREGAADQRQLVDDAVDTVGKKARMSEAESQLKPKISVEGRKAGDKRHMTIAEGGTVSNCTLSHGDSAKAQNGAPDATAAAEKSGGTYDDIPTDQHAWTDDHFRLRVTETLESYGDLDETQRVQMT